MGSHFIPIKVHQLHFSDASMWICRYKLGFCPNGPTCRYRHAKMPGPPPSVEEVFQKIQHLSSFSYDSNRFFQHRNAGYTQAERPQFPQGSAIVNNTAAKPSTAAESANVEQQQPPAQQAQQQQITQAQVQNLSNGVPNQVSRTTVSPLPQGQSRCVQSF